MKANRRLKFNQPSRLPSSGDSGIEDERVLVLVFESISWDIHTLCSIATVSRRFCAIARRILWRRLCEHRAPAMISALSDGDRIDGGWNALAKLMFYCGGGESTRYFNLSQPSPSHFLRESRFSKTSGRFFLPKNCRGDLLYVSDPCEHHEVGGDEHLGVFRGVFREFMRSKTRQCLVRRQAELEEKVRCPYCGGRVWSMTAARLVPMSAARRLGSRDGGLEFFVCVNGHLHGVCWLIPLSSEEEDGGDFDDEDSDDFYGSVV